MTTRSDNLPTLTTRRSSTGNFPQATISLLYRSCNFSALFFFFFISISSRAQTLMEATANTLFRVKSVLRSSNFLIFSRLSLSAAFITDAFDTVASLSDQVASVRGYFNIKSASPRSAFLSFPRRLTLRTLYQ